MLGLVGWAALAVMTVAAGLGALSLHRFMRRGQQGLSAGEVHVFSAYAEALLWIAGWPTTPAEAVASIGAFYSQTPGNVRRSMQLGAWWFERLPLLLGVSVRRFSKLPVARRLVVIHRASTSPAVSVNAAWEAVHTPTLINLSARPEALRLCRVDRPPMIAERRAARERDLARAGPGT
jgi:hypothetical protein